MIFPAGCSALPAALAYPEVLATTSELLEMLKERRSKRRRCPAYRLTNDLVVEILSRLPAGSVCRFKCVSRTWQDLISHSIHCKKLPQTLSGFFTKHDSKTVPWSVPCFTNVSGRGPPLVSPSFDFLPIHKRIIPLDTCNGLLLCKCCPIGDLSDFHYFVCNPATKEWVALPDSKLGHKWWRSCLCFNPTLSSHFYVFEFFSDYECFPELFNGVQVYSSETGERVHMEHNDIIPCDNVSPNVFLNGCLHYLTNDRDIAVLDTQGKACRRIPVPDNEDCGFIQLSQGRLHYANFEADDEDEMARLVVYVLEDYENQQWTLKHTAEASYVLGRTCSNLVRNFEWVAIHLDCNVIFYTVELHKTLMSYDMDRRQVKAICTLGEDTWKVYLPYVPLFSESQALHI